MKLTPFNVIAALALLAMPVFALARNISSNCSSDTQSEVDNIYRDFTHLPNSTKPGIYWYWMHEEVSKEGITKDLEALYSKGIGEVYIGNIHWGEESGPIKTLGDEWLGFMQHAIKEGSRIGIHVSTFNSPGWSQSGGPWVKPEDAMRYLVCSEMEVEGPATVKQYIGKPKPFFQDVSLLAYPVLLKDKSRLRAVNASPSAESIDKLTDFNLETLCKFGNKSREPISIDLKYEKPETKRSLYIKPGDQPFHVYCDVLMKCNGEFVPVKSHYFDRVKREVRMGADPSAPLVLSLGEATSDEFRIILKELPEGFELRELDLSAKPLLQNYPEKWLIKIPSKATPDWFAHIWPEQEQPGMEGVVAQKQIQNISSCLKGDTVCWDVPKGTWKILRVGMTTTNTTNQPAAPLARGLEIDKMNKRPIESHYNAYVGRIVGGLTPQELKSFTRVIADSYETGPQNWTDGFDTVFVNRYGYDPYPWMAVLTGQIVESAERSNRFLWDLRRLVAEQVASQYVGGMKEMCEKNGTQLWLENYGWDGFPSEFILYSKYSPAVGGEFWTNHGDNIECRLASSGCHMYGKNEVYAESYTTSGGSFAFYPGKLKQSGDRCYADGINRHILHLSIHQPDDRKVPGINSWFGIEYNRHNTWFDQSKSWIDYQRRCCYLLQQGRHHADVCFFIGEESPRMSGWIDEGLSKGYDYDFINSDVIEHIIEVKNGRLILPSGISYSLLVLPPLNTMRPEVLKRIVELVKQGASVLGQPLERSPSMEGYPQCDLEVQTLSAQLWGDASYTTTQRMDRRVEQGRVFCNVPINEVLQSIGTPEAVSFNRNAPLLWKQRVLNTGSLFFLSNQNDSLLTTDVSFNSIDRQPELWNPVDGSRRKLDRFRFVDGKTVVPITLDGFESCFILFNDKTEASGHGSLPTEKSLLTLDNRWDIVFHNKWTGERMELKQHGLENWAQSKDDRIKHFSGMITYKTNFTLSALPSDKPVYLCFEHLYEVASVSVNGTRLERDLWCKPYRLDVGRYLTKGKNSIEINVSNSWRNKIIEQERKPATERTIQYLYYSGEKELCPSGIWGRVDLRTVDL